MNLYTISSEILNHFGIINLSGYINESAGNKLKQKCDELMEQNILHIILDMNKVSLINSTGIVALIYILNKLLDQNGKLFIITNDNIIKKTLQIMGIDKYCEIVSDRNNIPINN